MMDKKELDEYKLKIRTIASFQEEADEYKKKSIISGVVVGLSTMLNLNEIIALASSKDNTLIHFMGLIGYSILTAMGFYYNSIMKDKQSDCEEVVLNLKEDLKNNK